MYCTECGAKLKDDVKFCTSCGTKVERYVSHTVDRNMSPKVCEGVGVDTASSFAITNISQKRYRNKGILFGIGTAVTVVLALMIIASVIVSSKGTREKLQKQLDLGQRYLNELNYDQALNAFQTAQEIDPENDEVYEGLINVFAEKDVQGILDTYEQAKEYLNDAELKRVQNCAMETIHVLVDTALNVGEYERAERYTELLDKLDVKGADELRMWIMKQMAIDNSTVGDIVTFGHYEQDNNTENGLESIEWQILSKEEGRTLVISRYGLDCQKYNNTWSDVTWETSTLRNWLENGFYTVAFDEVERNHIVKVTNMNPDSYDFWQSDYAKDHFGYAGSQAGVNGGNATDDHVFALSYKEALDYFDSDESRKCVPTTYAIDQGADVINGTCMWWLRSPGLGDKDAMPVNCSGWLYDSYGGQIDMGDVSVRPALWITTKKEIEYSERERTEQAETEQLVAEAEKLAAEEAEAERLAAEEAEAEKLAAEQAEAERLAAEQARVEITNTSVGEYVTFGHYEQDNNIANGTEPIEWQVLAKENGRTLLISRYGLDQQKYNTEIEDITWENCTLRNWLNNNFYYEAFDAAEQNIIAEVTNTNPDSAAHYMRYGGVQYLGAFGGNATEDYVFLLSYEEAMDYYESDMDRKCTPTQYAKARGVPKNINTQTCSWWLRSPGVVQNNAMVAPYSADGRNFGTTKVNSPYTAVRPAIWILD